MNGKGDRNRTNNLKQYNINYKRAFNKKCKDCDLIAEDIVEAEIECNNCMKKKETI